MDKDVLTRLRNIEQVLEGFATSISQVEMDIEDLIGDQIDVVMRLKAIEKKLNITVPPARVIDWEDTIEIYEDDEVEE